MIMFKILLFVEIEFPGLKLSRDNFFFFVAIHFLYGRIKNCLK